MRLSRRDPSGREHTAEHLKRAIAQKEVERASEESGRSSRPFWQNSTAAEYSDPRSFAAWPPGALWAIACSGETRGLPFGKLCRDSVALRSPCRRPQGSPVRLSALRKAFGHPAEAKMAVFDFIEGWYNPHRRHSALGYESPIHFERRKEAAA